MIVGRDALTRTDSESILKRTKEVACTLGFVNQEKGWNGYNILNRSQGQINALELGIKFNSQNVKDPKILFLLGCDNNISASDIPKNCFVVYVGSHGDQGAQLADMILPAATYTQKNGTYGNYILIQSMLKDAFKLQTKQQNLQDIQDRLGKYLEPFLKSAVLPFPTTVLKN